MSKAVVKEFKKILVPTDYSDLSLAAVEYALSFSRVVGASLYLLHALDTIPVLVLEDVDLTTERVICETEKNARSDLHHFVSSKIGDIPKLSEVVRTGVAEDEIVKFAKEENIDLIVMATHGRNGLLHTLMGSVAEKVIRRSPVPVLAVNPETLNVSDVSKDDLKEHSEFVQR